MEKLLTELTSELYYRKNDLNFSHDYTFFLRVESCKNHSFRNFTLYNTKRVENTFKYNLEKNEEK
jgi:hypothetical protein